MTATSSALLLGMLHRCRTAGRRQMVLMLPPRALRRTSAGRLLRGGPVPTGFVALHDLLAAPGYGYEVIVSDASGR